MAPDDKDIYKVVVSREGRYSIWPAHRENARGLTDEGKRGTKAQCEAHVKKLETGPKPGTGKGGGKQR